MLCRISLLLGIAVGLAAAGKRASYYPVYSPPFYSDPYYYEQPNPSVYSGYPFYTDVSPIPPLTAIVDVMNYGGDEVKGRIMFTQLPGGPVLMRGNVTGLTEGAHGLSVYEFGDLSKGCDSLGAHYNPTLTHHGGPADPYRHVGDLGNIQADNSGLAKISETDHLISLTGPHSIIGRGLVIHAQKDDFGRGGDKESLRTGNAGAKVACGVVAWALPPQLQAPKPPMDQAKEPEAESIEP